MVITWQHVVLFYQVACFSKDFIDPIMCTVAHSNRLYLQIHFKSCSGYYVCVRVRLTVCLCVLVVLYTKYTINTDIQNNTKLLRFSTFYIFYREEETRALVFSVGTVRLGISIFFIITVCYDVTPLDIVVLCVRLFVSHVPRKKGLVLHGQIPATIVQSFWLYPHTKSSITAT